MSRQVLRALGVVSQHLRELCSQACAPYPALLASHLDCTKSACGASQRVMGLGWFDRRCCSSSIHGSSASGSPIRRHPKSPHIKPLDCVHVRDTATLICDDPDNAARHIANLEEKLLPALFPRRHQHWQHAESGWIELQQASCAWHIGPRKAMRHVVLSLLARLPTGRIMPARLIKDMVFIVVQGKEVPQGDLLPQLFIKIMGRCVTSSRHLLQGIPHQLAACIPPYIRSWSDHDAAQALYLMAKTNCRMTETLTALTTQLTLSDACQGLSASDLVLVIWSCITLDIQPQPLWNHLLQALESRVKELNPHDLALSFWCVSHALVHKTSPPPSPKLISAMQQALSTQLHALSSQSAAIIAWSVAQLDDTALQPLVCDLGKVMAAQAKELTLNQLTTILYAEAIYKCIDPVLVSHTVHHLDHLPPSTLQQLTPGEKSRLLWALSRCQANWLLPSPPHSAIQPSPRFSSNSANAHSPAIKRLATCLELHAQQGQLRVKDVGIVLAALDSMQYKDVSLTSVLLKCAMDADNTAYAADASYALHSPALPAAIQPHYRGAQPARRGGPHTSGQQQVKVSCPHTLVPLLLSAPSPSPEPMQHQLLNQLPKGGLGPVTATQMLHALARLGHTQNANVIEQMLLRVLNTLPHHAPQSATQLAHLTYAASRHLGLAGAAWQHLLIAVHVSVMSHPDHWGVDEVVLCLRGLSQGAECGREREVRSPSQHLATHALLDLAQERLRMMDAGQVLTISKAAVDLVHLRPSLQKALVRRVLEHESSWHHDENRRERLASLMLSWSHLSGATGLGSLAPVVVKVLPVLDPNLAAELARVCVSWMDVQGSPALVTALLQYCNRLLQGGLGTGKGDEELSPEVLARLACVAGECLGRGPAADELVQTLIHVLCSRYGDVGPLRRVVGVFSRL